MGRFEEDLVASMAALCDDEGDCARHMFVLPARDIEAHGFLGLDARVERVGDVVMVCRDLPEGL